jgi:hypothetical protein
MPASYGSVGDVLRRFGNLVAAIPDGDARGLAASQAGDGVIEVAARAARWHR